jgi:hypothetical protein
MSVKDDVDDANKIADRASGLSVVLFAGLLISALNDFGPKLAVFRDAAIAARAESTHWPNQSFDVDLEADRIQDLHKVVDKLEKKREDIETKEGNDENDEAMEVRSRLDNAKENLAQTERSYRRSSETAAALKVVHDARRRATEEVKLKAFGFELGVQGSWASTVWLLMFLLGMLNLCFARFRFGAEIRGAAKNDEHILENVRVPLWLHPISESQVRSASAVNSLDSLSLAVVLLSAGCATAAFWLVRLTLATPILLAPGHELQGMSAGIAAGVLTAGLITTLSSWTIPVRLTHRGDAGVGNALRRRLLLVFPGIAVLCSAVAAPAPVRRILQATLLHPRRRHRGHETEFATGFYEHKKTHKIHYVPLEGHAKSLRGADMSNFVKMDSATLSAAHRPYVHVKALVPYCRQIVRNCGSDYDASARLLEDVLKARRQQSTQISRFAGSTSENKPRSESGHESAKRHKTGRAARSHGQYRPKSQHHRSKIGDPRQTHRDTHRPLQLLQLCDLLARLGARAHQPQYLDIAIEEISGPITLNSTGSKRSFAQRAQQIESGLDSRLIPEKRFRLRRFESVLRQNEERSERRKRESDLLQLIAKTQSLALDDARSREQRAKRRVQTWRNPSWMSEYNGKLRLIRHRPQKRKTKEIQK